MTAIKATIRNQRIELPAPDEWPDGTEVLVELTPLASDAIGVEESAWRDDPAARADWDAWIATFEPPELTTEEQAACARFAEQMRRFNREAVGKLMQEGSP
jgi:hypothetical protein